MEFDLLGPLTARTSGRTIHTGGPMHQLVLAILLTEPTFITTASLIDLLWPGDSPDSAVPRDPRARLHELVSDLRGLLRGAGDDTGELLPPRRNGYQAQVEREQVDLLRFHDRRRAARAGQDAGELDKAARQYREAFREWHSETGPAVIEPYAGLPGRWARQQRDGLRAVYLTDLLACIDVELQLGRHRRLVPELVSLNAAHPLDEQVTRLLMLACHRSEQTATSLQAYTRARKKLAEELGTEPGEPLRELHRRILRQDPTLLVPEEPNPPSQGGQPMNEQNSNSVDGIVVGPLLQTYEMYGDANFGVPAPPASATATAIREFRKSVRAARHAGVLPHPTAAAVEVELARILNGDDAADVMDGIRHLLDGAPDLVAQADEMIALARRGAL